MNTLLFCNYTTIECCLLTKTAYNALGGAAMNIVQLVSVILELIVAVVGVMLAVGKKKVYGWCFALTFGIYVIYDISKFASLNISGDVLNVIFFIASFSALWGIWSAYKTA
jgi:hypothetical protein